MKNYNAFPSYFIYWFDCSPLDSIELRCKYFEANWWPVGFAYECDAANHSDLVIDKANRNILGVNGTHLGSRTNADVQGVWINGSNVLYFPTGLQKIFINLEGIAITSSKLKEVKNEDLKQFLKLRRLDLRSNELQTLEKDLFQYSSKLEAIYLHDNKISYIDPNIFNNFVNKLITLYLSENICEFDNVDDNKPKINAIIRQIQTGSCTNETFVRTNIISEQLEELKKKMAQQNTEFTKSFNELKKELKEVKEDLSRTRNEIQTLDKLILELKSSNTTEVLQKRLKFVENPLKIKPDHGRLP